MKVCIVVPSYYPATVYGGPIVSIHECALQLSSLGVNINVSTTNANGKTRLTVEPNTYIQIKSNYRVKYYEDTIIGRFSWRFITSVWKDINRCDLVKIEDIFSTYMPPSLLYAKMLRKPILISPRGSLSPWSIANKHPFLKKLWLMLLIEPFIRNGWWHATSSQEADDIKKLFPKAKIVVIPNGVDLEQFSKPNKLNRLEYLRRFTGRDTQQGPIIISMGRLHQKKGFDLLIDAYSKILAKHPHALLLIAGKDDGEKKRLDQQISNLLLGNHILFVGELLGDDKLNFLRGGDLFVLPSQSENFGNVYLEALASGVPVVATRTTPWEEVERFKSGKWVENNVEDVTEAMLYLLTQDRKTIANNARNHALYYSWIQIAQRFEHTFDIMADNIVDTRRK